MKTKTNIKLELTKTERKNLRKHKIKKSEVLNFAADELEGLLDISESRAKELWALADFQRIPSIGIKFAEDLVFLGFYSVSSLLEKKGPLLLNDYEKKKGYKTDPCVEDQFWLVVDFAKQEDYSKKWWDFTKDRKEYRAKNGYPKDRPKTSWTEVYFPENY